VKPLVILRLCVKPLVILNSFFHSLSVRHRSVWEGEAPAEPPLAGLGRSFALPLKMSHFTRRRV
jgi:hypothetical protein